MYLIYVPAVIQILEDPIARTSGVNVLQSHDVSDDRSLRDLHYAILSHRQCGEEISFKVMKNLTKDKLQTASRKKLVGSCEEADREEIKLLWIDSCCIGVDEGEREEAIKSMYRWYQCSKTCYTYLHDVADNFPRKADDDTKLAEWFFRGWTLQELIAPTVLRFFNSSWQEIGDRRSLASTLNSITHIPEDVLQADDLGDPRQLADRFGVARVMSWAADRKTSKPEDRAYSLVGLFGVSLATAYGEGENRAFRRLQEALIQEYGDQTIFSWSGKRETGSVLADSPSDFQNCADVIKWVPPSWAQSRRPFQIGQGSVTTRLRLTRCRGSSYIFQAALACCHRGNQTPIVITLAELNGIYYRIFGDFSPSDETDEREITLCCRQVTPSSLMFDVSSPLEATTLGNERWERHDLANQVVSLTYARHQIIRYNHVVSNATTSHPSDSKSFQIILGFFIDHGSVHVVHDEPSGEVTSDVLHHTNYIDRSRREISSDTALESHEVEMVMHSHIPRTIQAVEVIHKSKGWQGRSIILNVVRCTGCCMPGWVSVRDPLLHNKKIAECFRKIRQSYCTFVCHLKSKLSRPHCFLSVSVA